ncbi:MAG: SpoIIE family protein phosphatase [Spirochaetes bacterium]|nr:SpoIIE family protein phosphatase [Spirochaetota bacterium]
MKRFSAIRERLACNGAALPLAALFVVAGLMPLGAEPVVVDDSISTIKCGRHISYLEDPAGSRVLHDVIDDRRWRRSDRLSINFGFTTSVYWMKFTLDNRRKSVEPLYFEIDYPMIDFIDFYVPAPDGSFAKKTAGDRYGFGHREVKARNHLFILYPSPGLQTYYFRVCTGSSLNFNPEIWSNAAYLERINVEYPLFWIYYGLMTAIFLYHIFLVISTRDMKYLNFSLFIGSYVLFQLTLNGLAFQYLWPGRIWWANNSLPFFISLTVFSVSVFIRSYLDARKMHPVLNKVILYGCILPSLAWTAVSLFLNYRISIMVATALAIICPAQLYICGLVAGYRKSRAGKVLVIGFSLLVLGVSLYVLKTFGVLPTNMITQWSIQLGSSTAVVLFSLGLADEINVMKRQLQDLNENLEKKVGDRTRELEEARTRLLELDKIKSSFFTNISHEIRTPLTLILSPVESVLQSGNVKAVDEEFLKNIQRNAIRLLRLINNILDSSKIEAGKMALRIREVDIVKVLKNYISTIQPAAESRGIALSIETLKDSITLHLDIEKIDKIFYNIFSNSMKFTDREGSIRVRIMDDEKWCYIEVEDTGVGIPSGQLLRIFDRFSQVDDRSTRKYEGTGIGLSLVREFVDLHGGRIAVWSRHVDDYPDRHGSVFTITLRKGREYLRERENVEYDTGPRLDEPGFERRRFVGVREMYDHMEQASDEGRDDGGTFKHTILIVEDNVDMRNFLVSILKDEYRTIAAPNGAEGLKKAVELRPDLIVTDVMMPIMNGYEMTHLIKENPSLRIVPIIMLTAMSEHADTVRGFEYGADDFLKKPFNSMELLARVRSHLKNYEYEKIIMARNQEIEADLRTARLLQQRLLPEKIPDISGYRSFVTYIPMDLVGGDFYDFKADGNSVELFIADVSGHGLPGALISTITKIAYENISDRSSPARVLEVLNEVICRSIVESNYVTVFYGRVDREARMMSFANAGHFPPLLYRPGTDEFLELNSKGSPLGWFQDLEVEESQVKLASGDRLLLYTDGITECMGREQLLFGDERLKACIRENIGLSPEAFTEKLMSELKDFCGKNKFDDDLCLIVFDVL